MHINACPRVLFVTGMPYVWFGSLTKADIFRRLSAKQFPGW